VRIQLALSDPIETGTTVKIMLGDTTGSYAVARGVGSLTNPAFTNPAPSDSGVYPTTGARGAFELKRGLMTVR